MSKINILILTTFLISFMVITSVARPDSTLQSKSAEMEKKCETDECLMKTTSEVQLDYIYNQISPPRLHAEMEKCETDECLMKMTSEAHVDYIYTQNPPPKPKASLKVMEKNCETDECLTKATSDAHLDYIYTQRSPLKPDAVKVNP